MVVLLYLSMILCRAALILLTLIFFLGLKSLTFFILLIHIIALYQIVKSQWFIKSLFAYMQVIIPVVLEIL